MTEVDGQGIMTRRDQLMDERIKAMEAFDNDEVDRIDKELDIVERGDANLAKKVVVATSESATPADTTPPAPTPTTDAAVHAVDSGTAGLRDASDKFVASFPDDMRDAAATVVAPVSRIADRIDASRAARSPQPPDAPLPTPSSSTERTPPPTDYYADYTAKLSTISSLAEVDAIAKISPFDPNADEKNAALITALTDYSSKIVNGVSSALAEAGSDAERRTLAEKLSSMTDLARGLLSRAKDMIASAENSLNNRTRDASPAAEPVVPTDATPAHTSAAPRHAVDDPALSIFAPPAFRATNPDEAVTPPAIDDDVNADANPDDDGLAIFRNAPAVDPTRITHISAAPRADDAPSSPTPHASADTPPPPEYFPASFGVPQTQAPFSPSWNIGLPTIPPPRTDSTPSPDEEPHVTWSTRGGSPLDAAPSGGGTWSSRSAETAPPTGLRIEILPDASLDELYAIFMDPSNFLLDASGSHPSRITAQDLDGPRWSILKTAIERVRNSKDDLREFMRWNDTEIRALSENHEWYKDSSANWTTFDMSALFIGKVFQAAQNTGARLSKEQRALIKDVLDSLGEDPATMIRMNANPVMQYGESVNETILGFGVRSEAGAGAISRLLTPERRATVAKVTEKSREWLRDSSKWLGGNIPNALRVTFDFETGHIARGTSRLFRAIAQNAWRRRGARGGGGLVTSPPGTVPAVVVPGEGFMEGRFNPAKDSLVRETLKRLKEYNFISPDGRPFKVLGNALLVMFGMIGNLLNTAGENLSVAEDASLNRLMKSAFYVSLSLRTLVDYHPAISYMLLGKNISDGVVFPAIDRIPKGIRTTINTLVKATSSFTIGWQIGNVLEAAIDSTLDLDGDVAVSEGGSDDSDISVRAEVDAVPESTATTKIDATATIEATATDEPTDISATATATATAEPTSEPTLDPTATTSPDSGASPDPAPGTSPDSNPDSSPDSNPNPNPSAPDSDPATDPSADPSTNPDVDSLGIDGTYRKTVYGHEIEGTLAGENLTYDELNWNSLLSNGVKNINAIRDAILQQDQNLGPDGLLIAQRVHDIPLDQDALRTVLDQAQTLFKNGNLTEAAHPEHFRLFHLSNATGTLLERLMGNPGQIIRDLLSTKIITIS